MYTVYGCCYFIKPLAVFDDPVFPREVELACAVVVGEDEDDLAEVVGTRLVEAPRLLVAESSADVCGDGVAEVDRPSLKDVEAELVLSDGTDDCEATSAVVDGLLSWRGDSAYL